MKRNIWIMYAIALLQGMVFYGPIATLYRQVQGVSIFQITVIESISLALCILLEIPWGIVADRIGYKKTLISCYGIYFVSKIIFWQADGFVWFLMERVLLSFAVTGISGVDTSVLYLSSRKADSQKVFGIYDSMSMTGLLFASGIFALFVKSDYRLAGLLTVISYGLSAFLSLWLVEVKDTKEAQVSMEEFHTTLRTTLSNRNLLIFLIAVAFLTETHQTITVFLNQLQYERCGLDNSAIGYIYIIATLVGMLGIYSSCVTKRLGIRCSFLLLSGLVILSCLTLALTGYPLPSVISILMLRLANCLFQPFQMELQNRQICTNNRATVLSIYAMIIDGTAVASNLAFGALSERNLKLAFAFGVLLAGTSLFLLLVWDRERHMSLQIEQKSGAKFVHKS